MQVLDSASIATQLSFWLKAWKVQKVQAQHDGVQEKESDSEWTEVYVIASILLHFVFWVDTRYAALKVCDVRLMLQSLQRLEHLLHPGL